MENDTQGDTGLKDFRFTGTAREWFGIWIVNLLLSIVTLGIYSAWAKVRRKRYFYQNTWVVDRNFDYHATGKQILIGRIIVVVGFILYSFLSAIPALALLLAGVLVFAIPWLITRSLAFNARMSSWSNVRFDFAGRTWSAFLVFIMYPLLSALTLFTTYPFVTQAKQEFITENHRLGTAEFSMESGVKPFYVALLKAILWVAAAISAIVLLGAAGVIVVSELDSNLATPSPDLAVPSAWREVLEVLTVYGFFFLIIFPAFTVYSVMVRNAVLNAAELDGKHRFRSDIRAREVIWIVMSNVVAIVCTLGLMIPWAQIRMARYLADHTYAVPKGSVDEFVGTQQAANSAVGDAFTDLEGVDLGVAF